MRFLGGDFRKILCLAIAGITLGCIAGFWVGRASLLRTAKAGLAGYGETLVVHSNELSAELGVVFRRVNHSQFPYCSDQELASLQATTSSRNAVVFPLPASPRRPVMRSPVRRTW